MVPTLRTGGPPTTLRVTLGQRRAVARTSGCARYRRVTAAPTTTQSPLAISLSPRMVVIVDQYLQGGMVALLHVENQVGAAGDTRVAAVGQQGRAPRRSVCGVWFASMLASDKLGGVRSVTGPMERGSGLSGIIAGEV